MSEREDLIAKCRELSATFDVEESAGTFCAFVQLRQGLIEYRATYDPASAAEYEGLRVNCVSCALRAITRELAITNEYASPLGQAMIDISQRCYLAEWLNTLAHDLWVIVERNEGAEPYGNGWVSAKEIANLRALAATSGCWCDWSEAEGRPVDVPLGEWLAKFWNVRPTAKAVDPDVLITLGEDGKVDMVEERLHLVPMTIKRGGAK